MNCDSRVKRYKAVSKNCVLTEQTFMNHNHKS